MKINLQLSRFRRGLVLIGAFFCLILGVATANGRTATPQRAPNQDPMFQISDEELKMFNLDPKETQELKQFFNELNKLSPAQKKELEELGRATEERMKQQNLDPNNLDDLMKFMENEGLSKPQPKRKPPVRKRAPTRKKQPTPRPKAPEKIDITPVSSPADAKVMLDELIARIASLRQKAITRPGIINQLDAVHNEVAQLTFYLNLLRSPDLVKLLTSKDFVQLHGALERLHRSFMTYEPSISARKRPTFLNLDDPYEVLDLPYNVLPEHIELQYEALKAARSPEAVSERLQLEGCDEQVCKRISRVADRTFTLIQKSYDLLKDPEKRAKIDEQLTEKIAQESRKEAASMRAFERLFEALQVAFTMGGILPQMHQVLEKHKPEEVAQMKAQLALEKKVYERSKKRVLVPQLKAPPIRGRQSPYDSFYRQMAKQQRMRRPRYRPGMRRRPPMPGMARPAIPGHRPEAPGKPTDKPKKDAKPDKKAPDKKKDAKKPDKPKEAKTPEFTQDDIKMSGHLATLADLLAESEDVGDKLTVEMMTRAGDQVESEQKLSQIISRLNDELAQGVVTRAPENLKTYADEHKLVDIAKTLKGAVPKKGKKLHPQVTQFWKDQIAKHKKQVTAWHGIWKELDFGERNATNKQAIPQNRATRYGLQHKDSKFDPLRKPPAKGEAKKPEPAAQEGAVNLGKIRATARAINKYFTDIEKAIK